MVHAVDLLPVIEGRLCPEAEAMDEVALCMKYASARFKYAH